MVLSSREEVYLDELIFRLRCVCPCRSCHAVEAMRAEPNWRDWLSLGAVISQLLILRLFQPLVAI